jgi:hypothetical protein
MTPCFYIFALCLASQGDGPYPVASATLGIDRRVLLGEGESHGTVSSLTHADDDGGLLMLHHPRHFGCGLGAWKCVA